MPKPGSLLALALSTALLSACAAIDRLYTTEYSFSLRLPGDDGANPDAPGCPGCASAGGLADLALLDKPPRLRAGFGTVHEALATQAPQAQAFHDQGLALLHSYAWVEAARSFLEVLRRDAACALSEVGLARALHALRLDAAAKAALERAARLAGDPATREHAHVALRMQQLEAEWAPPERQPALHAAYKQAIDKALARFPDDVELWLIRGNAEEPSPNGRGQHGGIAALAFYEQARKLAPAHPGATHYLVHCLENLQRYDEAVRDAEAYVTLAPAAPHAHHMAGHVLPRVGKWEEAQARFAEAERLSTELEQAEGYAPGDDWHRRHNLKLLGWAAFGAGKPDAAEKAFRTLAALPIRDARSAADHAALAELLLCLGRPQESLEAAQALAGQQAAGAKIAGHAVAAEALALLGKPKEGEAELAQAEKAGGKQEPQLRAARCRLLGAGSEEQRAQAQKIAGELKREADTAASFDVYGPALFRARRLAANKPPGAGG